MRCGRCRPTQNVILGLWVLAFARTTPSLAAEQAESSRYRKAQGLAAACHVDRGKAAGDKAAACAIALLVGFELALACAELLGSAPVQGLVLELDGAVVGIDRFGKAVDLLRLPGDVRVQALAGIDAIPAAADHALAVVG